MTKSSDKPKKSINFQANLPEIKDLRPRSRFEGSFISEEIEEFDEYQLEYDDFARLAALQLETVDNINLLKRSIKGRRFGASISVDEQTYWILDLSLRMESINPTGSKKKNNSISGLVSSIVKDSFKRPLIDTLAYDWRSETAKQEQNDSAIINLYKVCYIKDSFGNDDYVDIFLPDLTYHVVPAFKALLLAVSKPEILDVNECFLIATEFFDGFFQDDPLYPQDIGIEAILQAIDKTQIDFKKYFIEKINSEPLGQSKRPLTIEERLAWFNDAILRNLSERDIELFQERYELVKEIMKKSGDLIKI